MSERTMERVEMGAQLVARVEREVRHLPVLSATVARALDLLNASEVDLKALTDCLSWDQGLGMKLLQIANSPFYGVSRQIDSVREASICLGTHTIRNILLAAEVLDHFDAPSENGCDRREFWLHAMGAGVMAREVARKLRGDPELAFTAGLFHDLGRVALDTFFPAVYAKVLEHAGSRAIRLIEAERAVLGYDHADIGAVLADRWRFPVEIVEGIAGHHHPEEYPGSLTASLVSLADVLVHRHGFGSPGQEPPHAFSPFALERLDIEAEVIEEIGESAAPMLEEARALVELTGSGRA